MEVLLVVEVLHDIQVGLKSLDLGGEVFVRREEVECLVDVSSENINTFKLVDQFGIEGVPVSDVVEGPLFGKRDGLESESHFHKVISLGQGESVQDGRQPGVKVTWFAAPVRCIKFGSFEAGMRLVDEEPWVARKSEAVLRTASRAEQS